MRFLCWLIHLSSHMELNVNYIDFHGITAEAALQGCGCVVVTALVY